MWEVFSYGVIPYSAWNNEDVATNVQQVEFFLFCLLVICSLVICSLVMCSFFVYLFYWLVRLLFCSLVFYFLPYEKWYKLGSNDVKFQGLRLLKPDACPQLVYNIMGHCWSELPDYRPTFRSIIDSLNAL